MGRKHKRKHNRFAPAPVVSNSRPTETPATTAVAAEPSGNPPNPPPDAAAVANPTQSLSAAQLVELADYAVTQPQRVLPKYAELRGIGQSVRASLDALEAGREEEALNLVKGIPRQSPFADWKLFVRGLAAYYRHDDAEMLANWKLLDPARAARRIVVVLSSLMPAQEVRDTLGIAEVVEIPERLETALLGKAVIDRLSKLRDWINETRWSDLFGTCQKLSGLLDRVDKGIMQRLTAVLYTPLLAEAANCLKWNAPTKLVGKLLQLLPPLPIDPSWCRFWAIARGRIHKTNDELATYWQDYCRSLSHAAALSQSEQRLAKAIVWEQIARSYADRNWICPDPLQTGDPLAGAEALYSGTSVSPDVITKLIHCYRESIQVCPEYLPAYEYLASAYEHLGDEAKAIQAFELLAAQFPEHTPSLLKLARYRFRMQEPGAGLAYVERVRRLKPLDREALVLESALRQALAGSYAKAGVWELGRSEFEAAARLCPGLMETASYHVKRWAFELSAGQAVIAKAYLDRALQLDDPAAVLLSQSIESIRYEFSRVQFAEIHNRWSAEMKKKANPSSAASMSRLLHANLALEADYSGKRDHVAAVLSYIGKTTRLTYGEADLRAVCEFLLAAEADEATILKFVRKGAKRFPDEPYYRFHAADLELKKGPVKANRRQAYKDLSQAKELLEGRPTAEAKSLLELVNQRLTFLGEVGLARMPRHRPFFLDDEDEFDDEDDYFDGDFGQGTTAGHLREMINKMAKAMGVDPADLLKDLLNGRGPFKDSPFSFLGGKQTAKARGKTSKTR